MRFANSTIEQAGAGTVERKGGAVKTGLYHARRKAGLSQSRLADLANTTKNTVLRLEHGEPPKGMTLTREWAERFAPHLGVTAETIVFPPAGAGFRCEACGCSVLADPAREDDQIKARRCTGCWLREAEQRLNRGSTRADQTARAAGRAIEQAYPFGYRSEDSEP